LLEKVVEHDVLVYERIKRFHLEKKHLINNVLFSSTSVVAIENSNGGIYDRTTHTKILY
jgi:hypothetical protein